MVRDYRLNEDKKHNIIKSENEESMPSIDTDQGTYRNDAVTPLIANAIMLFMSIWLGTCVNRAQ